MYQRKKVAVLVQIRIKRKDFFLTSLKIQEVDISMSLQPPWWPWASWSGPRNYFVGLFVLDLVKKDTKYVCGNILKLTK